MRTTRRAPGLFDLVTMIMCDFSALAPTQRTVLLESVGRWLAPNGAFLFDVEALPYLASRELGRRRVEHPDGGFWVAGPHTEIAETLTYPEERVSLDRYTLSEAGRTWTIWNWLQAYDPASLTEVLRRAGSRSTRSWLTSPGGPTIRRRSSSRSWRAPAAPGERASHVAWARLTDPDTGDPDPSYCRTRIRGGP